MCVHLHDMPLCLTVNPIQLKKNGMAVISRWYTQCILSNLIYDAMFAHYNNTNIRDARIRILINIHSRQTDMREYKMLNHLWKWATFLFSPFITYAQISSNWQTVCVRVYLFGSVYLFIYFCHFIPFYKCTWVWCQCAGKTP